MNRGTSASQEPLNLDLLIDLYIYISVPIVEIFLMPLPRSILACAVELVYARKKIYMNPSCNGHIELRTPKVIRNTVTHKMSEFEPLTSTVKPLTQSVLTIRIIKSFPYRNVKNIILKDYDIANNTPQNLFDDVLKKINTEGGLRPYRNVVYDSLKIYTHAHGSKTMNLVINFEHDEDWFLDLGSEKKLHQLGVGEYDTIAFMLIPVVLTAIQTTRLRSLCSIRRLTRSSRRTPRRNGDGYNLGMHIVHGN